MTSFSDSDFSAKAYNDFRPSYNDKLYSTLIGYHAGRRHLAVDVGCGPGTATVPLAKHFARVIGVDPSAGMIEQARSTHRGGDGDGKVEFYVAPAEDLGLVIAQPGTVDLVAASQSAHWFKHDEWFREVGRILRPGGTLAYFGYKDHVFLDSKLASELIVDFSYGDKYLGPYWEPGREYLRQLFSMVTPPVSLFTDIERHVYDPTKSDAYQNIVGKSMTLAANEEYVRTWSSFHNYKKDHAHELSRRDGGQGDIVDRLFDKLKNVTGWVESTVLAVEWSSVIVLARRLPK
ncbi:S-adenosyl-L-methionine-dependent methyltransferase [Lipomyces japonicus]|uniref:S-adenosyl-L-methionine-dependent methyltransferase n=1 Tax=Lipomyces japonicus TaxID=56871 RepID=UPI0034CDCB8A